MAKRQLVNATSIGEREVRLMVLLLLVLFALIALGGFLQSLRDFERPRHAMTRLLYTPIGLGVATLLFVGFMRFLWRPLPWQPSPPARRSLAQAGGLLFLVGWSLYTWARVTLGRNYAPSTAAEAPLRRDHTLVTTGPYAIVRHPMYMALMIAGWGLVGVYRTWAALITAAMFLFLPVRARVEDRALFQRFGPAWEGYARRVPRFLPRLRLK